MEDRSAISRTVVEILESAPSKQLVGARLQFELAKRIPDFKASNYGYRNLLDFVRRLGASVQVIGRSGGDVIYGLRDTSVQPGPSSGLEADPNHSRAERAPSSATWRTFLSPNGICRLYANPETGEIRNLPVNSPALEQPWIQIPAASREIHLQVAKEFLDRVDNADHKDQLGKVLEQTVWWHRFGELARHFGLDIEWRKYRHSRLWSEFENALQNAGVSPSLVATFRPTETPRFFKPALGPQPAGAEAIRKLALSAIQNASISDLRKIWLPLGAVIDALENQ